MTQATLYQHSTRASKGNAFCWLTWPAQILWRGTRDELEAQNKRNQHIEDKRAAGIDPMHLPGLGGDTVRDPRRFVTGRNGYSPWHKSGIAR